MSKRLELIFDKDAASRGEPVWLFRHEMPNCWNARFAGKPAGSIVGLGYLRVWFNGRSWQGHRIIWCMVNDKKLSDIKGVEIDHIDHNPMNNHPKNLRPATHAQNMRNQAGQKRNARGRFLNVNWLVGKQRFIARCRDENGVRHQLGYFKDEKDAVAAVDAFKISTRCQFTKSAGKSRSL